MQATGLYSVWCFGSCDPLEAPGIAGVHISGPSGSKLPKQLRTRSCQTARDNFGARHSAGQYVLVCLPESQRVDEHPTLRANKLQTGISFVRHLFRDSIFLCGQAAEPLRRVFWLSPQSYAVKCF